jgi:E1A/CREB-binding protein
MHHNEVGVMSILSLLDRYDGLILSVGGNGRSYVVILETGPLADTSQSKQYFARMTTKVGFCRVSCVCINLKIIADFTTCRQSKNIEFDLLSFCYLCFLQVRVPFSAFRPVKPEDPPLDPFLVHTLTIRFEPKRQVRII